jgi:hypothetical protein
VVTCEARRTSVTFTDAARPTGGVGNDAAGMKLRTLSAENRPVAGSRWTNSHGRSASRTDGGK